MGLFTSLFGNASQKEQENPIPWKALTSGEQLDEFERESQDKLIAIFKHSTRCGISRMALKRFEKEYDLEQENVEIYLLDLLQHRDLSAQIAEKFGVYHESPQLIVIKNGRVVNHISHGGISADFLKEQI